MCRDCLRSFRSWGAPCVPSTTPVQGTQHHCTCVTLISSATEQGLFTSEMWLGCFFFFFLCLSQFIASALVTVWMRSAIKVYYLPNFAEPCLDTEWALCSEPFLARNQSTCVLGSGQIPALGARLRSPVFAGHIQFQTDCGCHENTLCIYFGRSHLNNQLLHWLSRSTAVGSCLPGWLPSWEMSQ